MIWTDIKSLLNSSLSVYSAKRVELLRCGKYTSSDHYQDGYVAMLYETLQELLLSDSFYPLDKESVRKLIYAFNRLTGEKVPDIWTV
jgi:hypothetical protein